MGEQGSPSDSAQGPWQCRGGVENALPILEGAKLGRMDTPWCMMVSGPPLWTFLTLSLVVWIQQQH